MVKTTEPKDRRKAKGRYGEELALQALLQDGYTLIEKNYTCSLGEIDIIVAKDNCLYFVEVRSKTGTAFGTGAESVTGKKRKKIYLAGEHFLMTKEYHGECGFLVVSIDLSNNHLDVIEDFLN